MILLRNIEQKNSLYNGTRLKTVAMLKRVIKAAINNVRNRTFISRMSVTSSNKNIPYTFKRRQFSTWTHIISPLITGFLTSIFKNLCFPNQQFQYRAALHIMALKSCLKIKSQSSNLLKNDNHTWNILEKYQYPAMLHKLCFTVNNKRKLCNAANLTHNCTLVKIILQITPANHHAKICIHVSKHLG